MLGLLLGSVNYAIGILLSQPGRIYTTGAGITTALKMMAASLGFFQGILVGSEEVTSSAAVLFLKTAFPFFTSFEGAVITIILNVGIGTMIWTRNWAVAMA